MKLAFVLALTLLLFGSANVGAQTAPPLDPQSSTRTPATPDPTQLTPMERELVRAAVASVGASHRRTRTSNGVGNIIGGVLVGGLGTYLYLSQDDPTFRLVGIAIAFSAVPALVSGMWNIFYHTAQEDMADKMLADDRLLDGGGLLFVEQEARRGKRDRLVGGSTSIVAGGATLASYFLLREFFLTGPDNILLIFFGVGTAIQVIQGIITLVGKSGPERAYAELLSDMGRDPLAPPTTDANSISKVHVVPTVLSDDGRAAPGLGLTFSF